jgi:putative ABC transport system permease protein
MKFLPLIWAGVWRRPGRTALTMISVASAFVIFGVLQGFTSGLDRLVASAQADIVVTQSRVGQLDWLPLADIPILKRTPGVRAVARIVFFGGPFRQPNAFLPAQAIDPDEVRASDDKLGVAPAQWAALKATRSGAIVPSDTAKLYGFKVGDRIPLTPQLYTNRTGAKVFPVDVVGIYPSNPDDAVFGGIILLNYDYIDQARASGAGTVNDYVVRIDDPLKAGIRSAAIDAQFANSPHETKTYSLRQLALASVARLGDVGLAVRLISAAVFFALLFSVGAVMIQSGRERTTEFAVLKTMGFGAVTLVTLTIAEAMAVCLAAAALGLAISLALYPTVMKAIQFGGFPPGAALPAGLVVALVLALITGSLPAMRAARLSIVDALAGR